MIQTKWSCTSNCFSRLIRIIALFFGKVSKKHSHQKANSHRIVCVSALFELLKRPENIPNRILIKRDFSLTLACLSAICNTHDTCKPRLIEVCSTYETYITIWHSDWLCVRPKFPINITKMDRSTINFFHLLNLIPNKRKHFW